MVGQGSRKLGIEGWRFNSWCSGRGDGIDCMGVVMKELC